MPQHDTPNQESTTVSTPTVPSPIGKIQLHPPEFYPLQSRKNNLLISINDVSKQLKDVTDIISNQFDDAQTGVSVVKSLASKYASIQYPQYAPSTELDVKADISKLKLTPLQQGNIDKANQLNLMLASLLKENYDIEQKLHLIDVVPELVNTNQIASEAALEVHLSGIPSISENTIKFAKELYNKAESAKLRVEQSPVTQQRRAEIINSIQGKSITTYGLMAFNSRNFISTVNQLNSPKLPQGITEDEYRAILMDAGVPNEQSEQYIAEAKDFVKRHRQYLEEWNVRQLALIEHVEGTDFTSLAKDIREAQLVAIYNNPGMGIAIGAEFLNKHYWAPIASYERQFFFHGAEKNPDWWNKFWGLDSAAQKKFYADFAHAKNNQLSNWEAYGRAYTKSNSNALGKFVLEVIGDPFNYFGFGLTARAMKAYPALTKTPILGMGLKGFANIEGGYIALTDYPIKLLTNNPIGKVALGIGVGTAGGAATGFSIGGDRESALIGAGIGSGVGGGLGLLSTTKLPGQIVADLTIDHLNAVRKFVEKGKGLPFEKISLSTKKLDLLTAYESTKLLPQTQSEMVVAGRVLANSPMLTQKNVIDLMNDIAGFPAISSDKLSHDVVSQVDSLIRMTKGTPDGTILDSSQTADLLADVFNVQHTDDNLLKLSKFIENRIKQQDEVVKKILSAKTDKELVSNITKHTSDVFKQDQLNPVSEYRSQLAIWGAHLSSTKAYHNPVSRTIIGVAKLADMVNQKVARMYLMNPLYNPYNVNENAAKLALITGSPTTKGNPNLLLEHWGVGLPIPESFRRVDFLPAGLGIGKVPTLGEMSKYSPGRLKATWSTNKNIAAQFYDFNTELFIKGFGAQYAESQQKYALAYLIRNELATGKDTNAVVNSVVDLAYSLKSMLVGQMDDKAIDAYVDDAIRRAITDLPTLFLLPDNFVSNTIHNQRIQQIAGEFVTVDKAIPEYITELLNTNEFWSNLLSNKLKDKVEEFIWQKATTKPEAIRRVILPKLVEDIVTTPPINREEFLGKLSLANEYAEIMTEFTAHIGHVSGLYANRFTDLEKAHTIWQAQWTDVIEPFLKDGANEYDKLIKQMYVWALDNNINTGKREELLGLVDSLLQHSKDLNLLHTDMSKMVSDELAIRSGVLFPVKPGYERLYRGEQGLYGNKDLGNVGRYFSTDIKDAQGYGNQIKYVDVPIGTGLPKPGEGFIKESYRYLDYEYSRLSIYIDKGIIPKNVLTNPAYAKWWDNFRSRRDTIWSVYEAKFSNSLADISDWGDILSNVGTPTTLDVSGRELTVADLAHILSTNVDSVTNGLFIPGLNSLRSRQDFVTRVFRKAESVAKKGNTTAKDMGFTKQRIQDVYDREVWRMRIDPDVQNLAAPELLEWQQLHSKLVTYAMSKNMVISETANDSVRKFSLALHDKIVNDPIAKEVGNRSIWEPKRLSSFEEAKKKYYLNFANYDNQNALNAAMRTIFPFWNYATHRLQYNARIFTRPGIAHSYSSYQENSDNGYIRIPTTDIQVNPTRGTILGVLRGLANRDYPEFYDQYPGLVSKIDSLSRWGFIVNPLVTGFINSPFGNKAGVAQTGDVLPGLVRSPFETLMLADPTFPPIRMLSEIILPSRYRDYTTSNFVSMNGANGPDILLKRLAGTKLTLKEQQQWDNAQRDTSGWALLMDTGLPFRLKPQEKETTDLLTKQVIMKHLHMKEADYDMFHKLGYPIEQFIAYPTALNDELNAIESLARWRGSTTGLQPSEVGGMKALLGEFWNGVNDYRTNIVSEQFKLDVKLSNGNITQQDWLDGYHELQVDMHLYIEHRKKDEQFSIIIDGEKVTMPITFDERVAWSKAHNTLPPILHPEEELLAEYYSKVPEDFRTKDTDTGKETTDWVGYFKWRQALESAMPPEILKRTHKWDTKLYAVRRNDYTNYIQPYKNLFNAILEQYSDDEQAYIKNYYATSDIANKSSIREVKVDDGNKLIAEFTSKLGDARRNMRRVDPNVDARLAFWNEGTTSLLSDSAQRIYDKLFIEYGIQRNTIVK